VGVERRLGPAKQTADANVAPLADWLSAWADDDGRPVHLFAHSLGARVTGATLRELADRERTDVLASVSLFGGAIPNDSVAADGRYGPAIAAVDAPCLTSTVGPITSSAGCIASRIGLAQSVTGARGVIDCADRVMRMSTLPTWSRTTTRTSSREKGVYREWSTELDVVGNVTEVVCSLLTEFVSEAVRLSMK